MEVALISPVQGLPEVRERPDLGLLASMDGSGAVLILPPDASGAQLLEQTSHGRPITASLNTGLNGTALEILSMAREVREGSRQSEDLAKMAEELSVRWVLLHKTSELDAAC